MATPSLSDDILRRGFDEFRTYVNPLIALRAELAGEPTHLVRAVAGALEDSDGKLIEDFHGAQAFGHRHPAIAAALRAFLDGDSPSWFPSRVNPYAGRLARVLCERTGYSNVFFGMSGSDAVEAAMKLARAATGRPRILSLAGAYHGCTFGSCALMSPGIFRDPFAPHLPGVEALPFDDVDALARAFSVGGGNDIAAVIVEPIQLEGGVRPLSSRYLDALTELCSKSGTLLVADEVQTGMGRTGRFLASSAWPRVPDVALLAKALGGGLVPVSAMMTRTDLYERAYGRDFESAEAHNSTFSGNALSAVAALAALELLDERCIARIATVGDRFRSALTDALAGSPLVAEVRGAGLVVGIETRQADHPWLSFDHMGLPSLAGRPTVGLLLCHRLYRRGWFCFVCGHDWRVLRLQPRFDIAEERLEAFVRDVVEELAHLDELS